MVIYDINGWWKDFSVSLCFRLRSRLVALIVSILSIRTRSFALLLYCSVVSASSPTRIQFTTSVYLDQLDE